MASLTSQVKLEGLEPEDYFEIFAVAIPTPGNPPILNHSGQEAYETVLEVIKTNKYLIDRANEISQRATSFVGTLRGLANVLNLEQNKCEETDLHLANIERLVRIAENDVDLGYHIARVRLMKFDHEQHLQAETDLATAEIELDLLREDFNEAINEMNKLETTRKVIEDCIKAGHDILAVL